jgi:hypothetical protein
MTSFPVCNFVTLESGKSFNWSDREICVVKIRIAQSKPEFKSRSDIFLSALRKVSEDANGRLATYSIEVAVVYE